MLEVVVPYALAQRRLAADHPDAAVAASSKITLLADGGNVLVPNTRTPGGWLCNHCSGEAFRQRLAEYGSFLESIGQEHVRGVIATALARRKAALSVMT